MHLDGTTPSVTDIINDILECVYGVVLHDPITTSDFTMEEEKHAACEEIIGDEDDDNDDNIIFILLNKLH